MIPTMTLTINIILAAAQSRRSSLPPPLLPKRAFIRTAPIAVALEVELLVEGDAVRGVPLPGLLHLLTTMIIIIIMIIMIIIIINNIDVTIITLLLLLLLLLTFLRILAARPYAAIILGPPRCWKHLRTSSVACEEHTG
jgi:hypothetical protein